MLNSFLGAINWGNVGIQVFYLLLSLSILVILHELGHFIPARIFKCRVEKFYLFFDPWFSAAKKKIGDTEYGIGWLPLGGYVKISGMVDESMDKEALEKPPQPHEFRSKPAWQRLIIMVGGVFVNVILAFIIYAFVLYTWGEKKIPTAGMTHGIAIQDSLMYELGFQNGDKIVAVDGKEVKYYDEAVKYLIVGEKVSVERNGKIENIQLPVNLIGKLVEKGKKKMPLFTLRMPVIVGGISNDTSGAAKAGLKPYDKIVSVDSIPTPYYDIYENNVRNKQNQVVLLGIQRGDSLFYTEAKLNENGLLGIFRVAQAKALDSLGIIQLEEKKYTAFNAIPAGADMAMNSLVSYKDQLKKIFSPETEAYKGVGGFKSMGSIFPTQWGDWETFWRITAFLSIVLAFMNLLPIPALDGGHVMFLLYEMVTKKKPSQKFLEKAQIVGMILLFGLMIYANANDWFGWNK